MSMRTLEPLQTNRNNETPRVFNPQYTLKDPVSTKMPLSPEAFYQRADMLKSSFSEPGVAKSIGGLAFNTKVRDYHQEALGVDDTTWRNVLGTAGFAAGAYAGAKVGASLGTFVTPGIGNAIGAGVGALTGGLIGSAGAQIASPSGFRGTTATLRSILGGVPEFDFRGLQFLGASLDQLDGAAIIKSGILSMQEKDRDFIESIKKAYAVGGEFEELFASDIRKNLNMDFGSVGNVIADFAGEALVSPGLWNAKIISGAKSAAQSKMIPTMLDVAKKTKFDSFKNLADPSHARRYGDIFLDATVNKTKAKTAFRDAIIKDDTARKTVFDIAHKSKGTTRPYSRSSAFNETVDELFEDMYTEFLKNESPESIGQVKRMMSGKQSMTEYLKRTDAETFDQLPSAVQTSLENMNYKTARVGWDNVVNNYPNLKRWQNFDDAAARALWFQVSPPLSLLKNSRRIWRFSKKMKPLRELVGGLERKLSGTPFKVRIDELKQKNVDLKKSIDRGASEDFALDLQSLEERLVKARYQNELDEIHKEMNVLLKGMDDIKSEADYYEKLLKDFYDDAWDKLEMRYQGERIGPEDKPVLVRRTREIEKELRMPHLSSTRRQNLLDEFDDLNNKLQTISDIEHIGALDRETVKFLVELGPKTDQLDHVFKRDFNKFRAWYENHPGYKVPIERNRKTQMDLHQMLRNEFGADSDIRFGPDDVKIDDDLNLHVNYRIGDSKKIYTKNVGNLRKRIESGLPGDTEVRVKKPTPNEDGNLYIPYTTRQEKNWIDLTHWQKKQAFYTSDNSRNVKALEDTTKEYLDAIKTYRSERKEIFNNGRINKLIDSKFRSLESKDIVRLSPQLRTSVHGEVWYLDDLLAYKKQVNNEDSYKVMKDAIMDPETGKIKQIGRSGSIVDDQVQAYARQIKDSEGNVIDEIDMIASKQWDAESDQRLYWDAFMENDVEAKIGAEGRGVDPLPIYAKDLANYGDEIFKAIRGLSGRNTFEDFLNNKIEMLENNMPKGSYRVNDWHAIRTTYRRLKKEGRMTDDEVLGTFMHAIRKYRPVLFRGEPPKDLPKISFDNAFLKSDLKKDMRSAVDVLSYPFRKAYLDGDRGRFTQSQGPATAISGETLDKFVVNENIEQSPFVRRTVSKLIKDSDITVEQAVKDPEFVYGLYVSHSYLNNKPRKILRPNKETQLYDNVLKIIRSDDFKRPSLDYPEGDITTKHTFIKPKNVFDRKGTIKDPNKIYSFRAEDSNVVVQRFPHLNFKPRIPTPKEFELAKQLYGDNLSVNAFGEIINSSWRMTFGKTPDTYAMYNLRHNLDSVDSTLRTYDEAITNINESIRTQANLDGSESLTFKIPRWIRKEMKAHFKGNTYVEKEFPSTEISIRSQKQFTPSPAIDELVGPKPLDEDSLVPRSTVEGYELAEPQVDDLPTIFDFADYEELNNFLFEARQYIKAGVTRDATGELTHRNLYDPDYPGSARDFSEYSSRELEEYIRYAFGKGALDGKTPDLVNTDKYSFNSGYGEDLEEVYNNAYDVQGLERAIQRSQESSGVFQMPFQKDFDLNNKLFYGSDEVNPFTFVMGTDKISKELKDEFHTLYTKWYKGRPEDFRDETIRNIQKKHDVTRMLQIQDIATHAYDRAQINKDITLFEMLKIFNREEIDFDELIFSLDGRSTKGGINSLISKLNNDIIERGADNDALADAANDLQSSVRQLRSVNNLQKLFQNLYSDTSVAKLLDKEYPDSYELGALMDFLKNVEDYNRSFFDLNENGKPLMPKHEIYENIDEMAKEKDLPESIVRQVKMFVNEAYSDLLNNGTESIFANSSIYGEINTNTVRFLKDAFDSIGELMDDVSARNNDLFDKYPELVEAKRNLYQTSRTIQEFLRDPLKRTKEKNRMLRNQIIPPLSRQSSEMQDATSSAVRAQYASPITIRTRDVGKMLSAEKRLLRFSSSGRDVTKEMFLETQKKNLLKQLQTSLKKFRNTRPERYAERFGIKHPRKGLQEEVMGRINDMEKVIGERSRLKDYVENAFNKHLLDGDLTALHKELKNLVNHELKKMFHENSSLFRKIELPQTIRNYNEGIRHEFSFGMQSKPAQELSQIFEDLGKDEDYMMDFLSVVDRIAGDKKRMETGFAYYRSILQGRQFNSKDLNELKNFLTRQRGFTDFPDSTKEIEAYIGYLEMINNDPLNYGFSDNIMLKWDVADKVKELKKGWRKPEESTELIDTYLDEDFVPENHVDFRIEAANKLGLSVKSLDEFNEFFESGDETFKEIDEIARLIDEADPFVFRDYDYGRYDSDIAKRIYRLFNQSETVEVYPESVKARIDELEKQKRDILRDSDRLDSGTWSAVFNIEKSLKKLKETPTEKIELPELSKKSKLQNYMETNGERLKELTDRRQDIENELDEQLDEIAHRYGGAPLREIRRVNKEVTNILDDIRPLINRYDYRNGKWFDDGLKKLQELRKTNDALKNFDDSDLEQLVNIYRDSVIYGRDVPFAHKDDILSDFKPQTPSIMKARGYRNEVDLGEGMRQREIDNMLHRQRKRPVVQMDRMTRSEANLLKGTRYSEVRSFIQKRMYEKFSYQNRFKSGSLMDAARRKGWRRQALRFFETTDMVTIREIFQDADDFARFLRDNPEYKLTTVMDESTASKRVRDASPFFRHTTDDGEHLLYKSNISHEALDSQGNIIRERAEPHVGEPYMMGVRKAHERGDYDKAPTIKEIVVDDDTSMRDLFNMGPDELGNISLMSHENYKLAKKMSYNKAKLPPVFDKYLRGWQRVVKQDMLLTLSWNPTNLIDVAVKNTHALRGRWSATDYVHYLGEANFYYTEWSKLKNKMMGEVHRLDSTIHDKLRDVDHFRKIRDNGTDPDAIRNAKDQISRLMREIDENKKRLRNINGDEVSYFEENLMGDFDLKTLERDDPDTDTIAYGVYKHLRKRREFRRATDKQKQKMLNEHYEDYISMMKLVSEFEKSSASTDIAAYMRNLSEDTFSEFRGRTLYSKTMNWLADENPLVKANMTAATRIEQVGRLHGYMLDTFVWGKGHDESIYRSLKRHYDYSERSMLEAWSNLIFPFIQFPTRNALFWAEELSAANNSRRMMNKLDALWGDYDLNDNEYAQDARMRGYIPIGDEKMLRISDSRLSAVRFFNNPKEEASNRLSPMIKEPLNAISGNKSVANSAISAIPYVNRLPDAVRRIRKRHTNPPEVTVAPRLFGQLYQRTGYNNYSNRYDVYKNLYDKNGNYRYREGADPYYKVRSIMYRQRQRQWR